MVGSVDLLVPEVGARDATGNHTLLLRDMLLERGVPVRIVVGRAAERGSHDLLVSKWKADADLTILQHSIGSAIAEQVIRMQVPVVLNYHNITPSGFLEAWQPQQVAGLEQGRTQLRQLAPLTRRGVADSLFNARELIDAGVADVVVAPVLWQLAGGGNSHGSSTPGDGSDGSTVLFVGRIAPNKCQHDLIAALAVLSRSRPEARLVLVGRGAPEEYLQSLRRLASRLQVDDRIVFAGDVSGERLLQWYRRADVFACASEHEGFGVPLVEAMACGLPVVAYSAAAVAETVGGAGIVLNDKRPATLAAAIDRALGDRHLRVRLRELGLRRAQQLDIAAGRRKMWTALSDLVIRPAS